MLLFYSNLWYTLCNHRRYQMIETRNSKQTSFLGNYVYDKIVSKDHILRKIQSAIDLSFVNDLCRDAYCLTNGRPGWSPVVMFKIVFLQFLYDLSDYEIEDELNDRLSFKMFSGLEVDEAPPDHSSVSRFRDRLGPECFTRIFSIRSYPWPEKRALYPTSFISWMPPM